MKLESGSLSDSISPIHSKLESGVLRYHPDTRKAPPVGVWVGGVQMFACYANGCQALVHIVH
jgi:hypothetical protein